MPPTIITGRPAKTGKLENFPNLIVGGGVRGETLALEKQRMVNMKDLSRKIRAKGRVDAKGRYWVSELLAVDCEKAWIYPGWEEPMQKWYDWLSFCFSFSTLATRRTMSALLKPFEG